MITNFPCVVFMFLSLWSSVLTLTCCNIFAKMVYLYLIVNYSPSEFEIGFWTISFWWLRLTELVIALDLTCDNVISKLKTWHIFEWLALTGFALIFFIDLFGRLFHSLVDKIALYVHWPFSFKFTGIQILPRMFF